MQEEEAKVAKELDKAEAEVWEEAEAEAEWEAIGLELGQLDTVFVQAVVKKLLIKLEYHAILRAARSVEKQW